MLPDLGTLASLCAAPARDIAGVLPLVAAMGLAGLAGGATHCAAMCGPLLLLRGSTSQPVAGRCLAARVRTGLRLPEQAGRVGAYVVLGAAAGQLGNGFTSIAGRWLPVGALLFVGAASLFAYAAWRGRSSGGTAWPHRMQAWLAGRLAGSGLGRRVGFGVALALLPCALLHAALLAAAATAHAATGALAMGAFALGTMPGLAALTIAGRSLTPRRSLVATSILCVVVAARALVG